MTIQKSDIVPILQHITHQKCEYTLLRPENLIDQPNSYSDVDLCMRPEVMPEFIRYLTTYAEAKGASVETKQWGPFATAVAITQDHQAPIKLDIQTRIAWRGFTVFYYNDLSATTVSRNDIRHVDKQHGDVIVFVKELFGYGTLRKKSQWWPDFVQHVEKQPNIYRTILVNHVFMFLTKSLIDRIHTGDRLWIENHKLLLQGVFIATQLTRRPFASISGHLQWWALKMAHWTRAR